MYRYRKSFHLCLILIRQVSMYRWACVYLSLYLVIFFLFNGNIVIYCRLRCFKSVNWTEPQPFPQFQRRFYAYSIKNVPIYTLKWALYDFCTGFHRFHHHQQRQPISPIACHSSLPQRSRSRLVILSKFLFGRNVSPLCMSKCLNRYTHFSVPKCEWVFVYRSLCYSVH